MDNELAQKINVLVSIQAHKRKFPEPHNQVVRDIAERRNVTTGEVMRLMRENQEERSMHRLG